MVPTPPLKCQEPNDQEWSASLLLVSTSWLWEALTSLNCDMAQNGLHLSKLEAVSNSSLNTGPWMHFKCRYLNRCIFPMTWIFSISFSRFLKGAYERATFRMPILSVMPHCTGHYDSAAVLTEVLRGAFSKLRIYLWWDWRNIAKL